MSSIRNLLKKRREPKDRITNLPECLKTKILSSLPTKDAVRTSVLSREWERSWTSVTSLDFSVGLNKYEVEKGTESLMNFVTRVLLLRERVNLQKFRVSGYELILENWQNTSKLIDSWIGYAIDCNVEEIDLFIITDFDMYLDSSLYLCKTLEVLKLDGCGVVQIPTGVSLPRLKTLHIEFVDIEDDTLFNRLISGCPILEELRLRRCIGHNVTYGNIIAPALRSLTIEDLPWHNSEPFEYYIMIDTPDLQYLEITDEQAMGYKLKNLYNLIEAVISVGPYQYKIEDFEDQEIYASRLESRAKCITDILSGVSHAQRLLLQYESLKTIQWFDLELPTFRNLTFMEVSMSWEIGCDLLLKLLENCPRLETLYLTEVTKFVSPGNYIVYDDNMPPCLLSHLKLKVIKCDEYGRGLFLERQSCGELTVKIH